MAEPESSPWVDMARELASNPDSPKSLAIMSSVNAALSPSIRAGAQLVEAIANQIEYPCEKAYAGVAAATAAWEKSFGNKLDIATLALFRKDAQAVLDRRASALPTLESIVAGVGERTDAGYAVGVHLEGIRAQFEARIGRALTPAEWAALVAHAGRSAAAMAGRF